MDKIKTGELYTKGSITYTFENLPAGLHDAKFVSGADSYTKEVEMLKVTLIFVDENDIDVQDIADNTITVVVKNYKGVITVNFHIISSKFVIEFSNSSGFRYVLCRENVLIFLHIGTGEYFL